jgi:hypothetical protein
MSDNEMIERVAKAIADGFEADLTTFTIACHAIEAMRELPGEPGPRYTAGEYSRRNQESMIDDALGVPSRT